MIDENQLIAPKPDVDYRALSSQPSPEDFFLLSRVTGPTSVKQLCATSGLGRDKTIAALERLLEFGLVHEVDANGKPKAATKPAKPPSEPAGFRPRTDSDWGAPAASLLETSEGEVIAAGSSRPVGGIDTVQKRGPARRPEPTRPEPMNEELRDPQTRMGMFFDDEEDDLFMPSSPAHRSRLQGDGSPGRESGGARPSTSPGGGRPASSDVRGTTPLVQARAKVADAAFEGPRYSRFPSSFDSYVLDESLLVENVDAEMLREIYFVHAHLEHIDFYELFDLEEDADRSEIKTAYFAMSKRFHPDKFFRQEAPEISSRVEAIFKFVTKGYETLSKPKKREEYDRALSELRNRAAQASAEENRKREMAAELLERRAKTLEEQGDLVRASGEFKKVAALRRDAHALLRSANLLLRANQQLDEAAKLARTAMIELRTDAEPRLLLGQIYEKNGMLVEALSAFEEAQELAPGDPSVRVHVERVRSQLG